MTAQAWSQTEPPLIPVPSASEAEAESREVTPTDTAFEPLRKEFAVLFSSLRNLGGISDDTRPIVEGLAARAQLFMEGNDGYVPAIVLRLQLAMWLDETEQIGTLFEQLVASEPDNADYSNAWIRHAQQQEDDSVLEHVFDRLSSLQPENKELILRRVETLRDRNQYADALGLLDQNEIDLTEHPQAAVLRSDLLFAENRFQEALDALNAIPDDVLIGSDPAAAEARRVKSLREEYVRLWNEEQEKWSSAAEQDDLPRVELLTDKGRIVVELFEDDAPNTVANFITLVEQDFYTSMPFHRVLPNFMAQVGDPSSRENAEEGTTDGPGYRIADEHGGDDYRRHFAGTMSMANKSPRPDSGGSQFFLTHRPTDWLNGRHTVFGRVLEGLPVVRSIEQGDLLQFARVIRKRDHEYPIEKLTDAVAPTALPIPQFNVDNGGG